MVSPDIGFESPCNAAIAPQDGAGELVIGILNNMPAAAMRRTGTRFIRLLANAAQGRNIRLRHFSSGAGGPSGRFPESLSYESLDALWESSLDGLIVTGTEPQASEMTAEPLWPVLARLTDWAASHTISTIWSCFAAHASVLRMDGLARQPFDQKLSGVFACRKIALHYLLDDAVSQWPVPHSRFNTLDPAALVRLGYTILSYAPRTGADSFVKLHDDSLFVFLQGHPEYEWDMLLREYCRDVERFHTGQRQTYPGIPENYFDRKEISTLAALQEVALRTGSAAAPFKLETMAFKTMDHDWHGPAASMYSRWLSFIAARKRQRVPETALGAPFWQQST